MGGDFTTFFISSLISQCLKRNCISPPSPQFWGSKITVSDYLAIVHSQNIEPEKPFKGSFNIRTGSDLHRRVEIRLKPSLRIAAKEQGINLNKLVNEALEQYLKNISC